MVGSNRKGRTLTHGVGGAGTATRGSASAAPERLGDRMRTPWVCASGRDDRDGETARPSGSRDARGGWPPTGGRPDERAGEQHRTRPGAAPAAGGGRDHHSDREDREHGGPRAGHGLGPESVQGRARRARRPWRSRRRRPAPPRRGGRRHRCRWASACTKATANVIAAASRASTVKPAAMRRGRPPSVPRPASSTRPRASIAIRRTYEMERRRAREAAFLLPRLAAAGSFISVRNRLVSIRPHPDPAGRNAMLGRLTDPEIAHRRRWLTLLVLCLSLMVIGLDNTILNVALPTLAKPASAGGLGASASQLQWIVDSYTHRVRRPAAHRRAASVTASAVTGASRIGLVDLRRRFACRPFAPSATLLIGTARAHGRRRVVRSCRRRCRSSPTSSTTHASGPRPSACGPASSGDRHRHRPDRRRLPARSTSGGARCSS